MIKKYIKKHKKLKYINKEKYVLLSGVSNLDIANILIIIHTISGIDHVIIAQISLYLSPNIKNGCLSDMFWVSVSILVIMKSIITNIVHVKRDIPTGR